MLIGQDFTTCECHDHHEDNSEKHCEFRNTPQGIPLFDALEELVQSV